MFHFLRRRLSLAALISLRNLLLAVLVTWPVTPVWAQSAGQVESLKESVLTLNRDLLILEEELLYPASTQIAVYVSMDLGQYFALDAIKLEINNQLVASELYTDKQTKALFRGGVQRLYIGNLKTGEHEISAFFTGRGPQQDYKRGAKITLTKNQEPVVLELKIIDSTAQMQPEFTIKQWQM
uniref:AraC family transcriptional regulator n=1 Tax=Cellvibrio fontiphilus TaxID=1815559 RepID=UPI002B4BBC53|nr:AraC family transcriptional regulator [Cellvibrio fontiphilus]